MGKGASFEREFCKQLSLWWTKGERDDVFWRTHGSGARATQRAKAGKRTKGQYGDVCATDPIGIPLTELIVFSLKRGCSKHSLQDLLDCPKRLQDGWETWIEEVEEVHRQSGSKSWIIVVRRDRRNAIGVMPLEDIRELFINPALIFRHKNKRYGAHSLTELLKYNHVLPQC